MGYHAHLPPELIPLPCGNENQEQSPCPRGAEEQNKKEQEGRRAVWGLSMGGRRDNNFYRLVGSLKKVC